MALFQQVTLSILTWKAPDTLVRTLQSLEPLHELFQERIVICQEGDQCEIDLAERYGYRPVAIPCNVGIQEGLALAVENAATELVLVLENDCNYIGGQSGKARLQTCLAMFEAHHMDVARLGELPPTPRKKYVKCWGRRLPPRRTLFGMLRWNEADSCKAEAISLAGFKSKDVPELEGVADHLFLTSSRHIGWKNRAFLVRKDFFLGQLLPFARSNPTSRLVNGLPDLEHAINSPKNRNWWRTSDFKIGITKPGLFSHKRYDRPDLDEKWSTGGTVESQGR